MDNRESAILEYSPTRVPKPFRLWLFFIAVISSPLAISIPYVCALFYSPFFPPPPWVNKASIVSFIFSGIGLIAGVFSICTVGWRVQSSTRRGLMLAGLVWAVLSPAILVPSLLDSMDRPRYHLYPYQEVLVKARHLKVDLQGYALQQGGGTYPPHLAMLIFENHNESILNGLGGRETYMLHSPLPKTWQELVPDVDEKSIFIYTGADLVEPVPMTSYTSLLGRRIVCAYTKRLREIPNHRILVFASGDPKLIPDADLPKYFDACNTARAKLGLPPIALDGPPPKPPH
jgi:hypothetical protein